MKHYEIQEFEAKVRSILSHWGMKDEAIDVAIKDDVYLNFMEEERVKKEQEKKNTW